MNINKIIIFITIITIVVIIGLPTFYKVVEINHFNLSKVAEKNICEKAIECVYDGNCQDVKVTLKNLYDLGYLEQMTDPVTKEIYDENSYVLVSEKDSTFYPLK